MHHGNKRWYVNPCLSCSCAQQEETKTQLQESEIFSVSSECQQHKARIPITSFHGHLINKRIG